MKTILVIYSHSRVTNKQAQGMKKYAFNVSFPVKVGDRFTSEDYTTPMQVVGICSKTYKYVDTHSGKLANKPFASTKNFELRELIFAPVNENTVIVERE